MSKSRIDRNKTAERFLSGIQNNNQNDVREENIDISIEKKETKKTRPFIKDGGYSQRAYYITDEQYKELKMLAVENDTDTSSLVREALSQFLEKNI